MERDLLHRADGGGLLFLPLAPRVAEPETAEKAVQQLKIGDEVVTSGGLIGEVKDVVVPVDGPTEIILELAPGVRVRALTDAIQRRLSTLEPSTNEASTAEVNPGEVSHNSA
ncbi:MAG: preprotein translocase subunit YajC [Dehalococcoidia bacterium]|nr:preprotein translocase subunit YajC [Dehalococcoidia bacterium]